MPVSGGEMELVSTGDGRTTCSYFFPAGDKIVYSSTHLQDPKCPPPPDYSQGYVWALYPGYDVFIADRDGGGLQQLTDTWRYDAEATVSRDGQTIVFTSLRDGDLDIYAMDADGSNVRKLTDELGYDGGPFFSYDGSKIVYRAYHPKTAEEEADYLRLLEQEMIRPSQLDIFVMDADGSNKRQLTDNGAANFAPYFFPDGMRIIFVSNMHEAGGRNFDLYMINIDGTGLERVTYHEEFDGFPMFNSDGSKLVWASNRFNADPGDTNIFVADWID
jgi:Tol biopolymer transport system component